MSSASRIYWIVGIGSLALMLAAFLFPGKRPDTNDLPWHIEHPAPGQSRVFGLTLGESTPDAAEQRFRERGEFGLFRSPDGRLSAEVYFEQINLAGLRSKVVLTLQVGDEELRAIHDRGVRMSATGGGKKIAPAPDDIDRLRSLPIASLTLIPGIRVADELFEKRFGKPARIIREKNAEVVHNLYPAHGLDITTGGSKGGKQVLQYVAPKQFDRLLEPLLKNGEELSPR